MTSAECVDQLLAPDSDEESIDISDEEYNNLLDAGEGSEAGDKDTGSVNFNFFLDEELDYEPGDDDHDLIVDVTAEDMFEDDCDDNQPEEEKNDVFIQEPRAFVPKKSKDVNGHVATYGDTSQNDTKSNAAKDSVNTPDDKVVSKPHYSTNTSSNTSHTPLPSFLTRVRERLASPSPAMVCWHRCHLMKDVHGGLEMTTSIITWHRVHAWSVDNTKKTISDKFGQLKSVSVIEEDNIEDRSEGGAGRLSDRFGVLAQKTQERLSGKRKGEELGQVRNKIMKKLCRGLEGRKERFGEVNQNCFDNVKYLSDKWRF